KSTSTFDKVVTEVDSIEMENIDSIVVHMGDNENTFSAVHAKDFVTFFKSLKVKKKEVNKSHEESIEKEISVTITYGEDSEESDTFYITDEMIWFDDGVKSSYSYQIVDFEEVETFIESKFEDTSSYGIAPPIESLSWGMSVDECKKNLANYTFELISNEGGLMYRVSSEMSLFDYTDEIDQVILKFDSAITEPVYPYHTDALTSIQFIFHEIDVDKMKDKVTDLVGAEGTHWVDIRKSDFITWESVDTVKNLDKASYKLLEDFWTLLDEYALDSFLAASKEASELINRVDMSDGLLTARKENSEPINKVKMQYTEDGICSVEFYAGMNLFLYNLR
ncbi:hypothetical protein, partial [Anaerosporobacter sp.]|uniref:hypothetical protein n=1 Tax=Anaerosporobacter sp. TaxID=1872529 RepID=UPI00286FAA45